MESNSVCNHTRDKQVGLPLRGRPSMITDRIGLHSVLLPLLVRQIHDDNDEALGMVSSWYAN